MTEPTHQDEGPEIWPGHHQHRGAFFDGSGTNFAVWAPDADQVDLCLFDDNGVERRLALPEFTLGVWHGYLPGIGPGQRYGFRAHGPWDLAKGLVFNPDKLLLDPYARAIDGTVTPDALLAAVRPDGSPNPGDTAGLVPRSVVIPGNFDWGDDQAPQTPWSQTIVYEAHVKGLTMLAPNVPEALRGTYAGLAHDSVLEYLTGLGVTAVELLPVHALASEPELVERGLVNYWGYNTLGYFAPHGAYSSAGTAGGQVGEFKAMVKALHGAGLEVILDVVYNHTAEGGINGPCLSFRGLSDKGYYLRSSDGRYFDVTGCGNTVQVSDRQVLELVMDSLRYWILDMHVDGFRFDLAPALCRSLRGEVDLHAAFLTAVHQDPVLREVKLIAEPWDATGDGYLVGSFPPPWCEWNDKFRDGVRDFWRGQSAGVRDLAYRVSGSSDLYADDDRLPFASVNFVTAHDGFTLRDLVSYDSKHNESNGFDNRDGTDDNRSWNCGAEGESDDAAIVALRRRQAANMLGTLLLSTGVPMLVAGDERGRTQDGNNNAFCHDDETTWVSWDESAEGDWAHLLPIAKRLLELRAAHPVLRQRYFFDGRPIVDGGRKDISWLQPDGSEMDQTAWDDSSRRTLGVFLSGDAMRAHSADGRRVTDTSYLLWLHSGDEPVEVTAPKGWADHYLRVLHTDSLDEVTKPCPAERTEGSDVAQIEPGEPVTLEAHSLALYEAVQA